LLFGLAAQINTHTVQEPIEAPVHRPHQYTSPPHTKNRSHQAPLLAQKSTQKPKNISTPTKQSTAKMALTSWAEYHKSLLKNEPWVEKLKKAKQSDTGVCQQPRRTHDDSG
jgi:hypothetical protein